MKGVEEKMSILNVRKEKKSCVACKKDFYVVWITLASKMDDKKDDEYKCPYCGKKYEVILLGNEMVESEKID